MADIKIACPHCNWEPDGRAYWSCSKCKYTWDTFQTAARCPLCGHQHDLTQCILLAGGCNKISPHEDWYLNLDDMLIDELSYIEVIETRTKPAIDE